MGRSNKWAYWLKQAGQCAASDQKVGICCWSASMDWMTASQLGSPPLNCFSQILAPRMPSSFERRVGLLPDWASSGETEWCWCFFPFCAKAIYIRRSSALANILDGYALQLSVLIFWWTILVDSEFLISGNHSDSSIEGAVRVDLDEHRELQWGAMGRSDSIREVICRYHQTKHLRTNLS